MAYTKTNWVNGSAPAINAANLNKIEQGIADCADQLDADHFAPGEVFNRTYPSILPCAGLVTTSTTTVYFTISLPKKLDNVTSVTVNALTGGLRGISGYVNGTNDSTNLKNNYTVTAQILDARNLKVQIAKSSAMTNTTNNTPVTVAVKAIKLTFA